MMKYVAFWVCAVSVAQVSPCGVGQQLSSNAPVLSGSSTYWSPAYISSNNLSVNLNGNTVTGNANMTLEAGTAICFGPGFQVAGSTGGFTALIGSSAPPGAYAITTNSLPQGNVGTAYSASLAASGGTPNYSWSIISGSLPSGLGLNVSTGQISGTPNTAGAFPFTVQATDALQATATVAISITVTSSGQLITSLTALQACLTNAGQTSCILAAMTFPVTTTITISRYGVTLAGQNTLNDHTQTRLVRDPSFSSGPLIQVEVPGGNQATTTLAQTRLSGIVLRDLTICGGGNTHPNTDPALKPAIMSQTGPCSDHSVHPPASGCDWNNQCVDLNVTSVDSGYYPANPFTYSGPYALELNNVDMEDAAGHAVSLYSAGPYAPGNVPAQKVNDVWIHDSVINYSAITGILYGFNFQTYDNRFCDSYAQHEPYAYADDPSLVAPRNIRIEKNMFKYNNTGVMGGGAMRWVGLRNNTFFVNYISPQAGNGEGGTVQLDGCTDRVDISGNTFTGPSARTVQAAGGDLPPDYQAFALTSALELYSRNTNIQNNKITAYGLEGIGAISLYYDPSIGNKITQNHVLQDNGWYFPSLFPMPGISVGTSFAATPCDTRPRESDTVAITANDSNAMGITGLPSTQAYGVRLEDHGGGPSTDRLFNMTVDQSNFSGPYPLFGPQGSVFIDAYVGLYDYSGQPYLNTPNSADTNPRLLLADVVDASSSTSSLSRFGQFLQCARNKTAHQRCPQAHREVDRGRSSNYLPATPKVLLTSRRSRPSGAPEAMT